MREIIPRSQLFIVESLWILKEAGVTNRSNSRKKFWIDYFILWDFIIIYHCNIFNIDYLYIFFWDKIIRCFVRSTYMLYLVFECYVNRLYNEYIGQENLYKWFDLLINFLFFHIVFIFSFIYRIQKIIRFFLFKLTDPRLTFLIFCLFLTHCLLFTQHFSLFNISLNIINERKHLRICSSKTKRMRINPIEKKRIKDRLLGQK